MVQDTQQQLTQITATRQKLEHQQHKLLQAHYEGAIPVELLRKEQQRITRSLTAANHRIQTLEQDLEDKEELVGQALDIAQHMAIAYHHAPNHIRRMLNQLFFEHVYLVPGQDAGQIADAVAVRIAKAARINLIHCPRFPPRKSVLRFSSFFRFRSKKHTVPHLQAV